MALRSSWEGYLKFNLISVPVKAYNAAVTGRGRIAFHQVHAECGSRIRHKKVCPIHGEVPNDQIVSGYEYGKDEYITIKPDEIAALRSESDRVIDIQAFVEPDAIAPRFYSGRTYYLAPEGKVARKPYAVMQKVMAAEGRSAVARVVFANRAQMVLIRPVANLLTMSFLYYADQVHAPTALADEIPDEEIPEAEKRLAETLVASATVENFDLAAYKDDYEEKLSELVEAKAKGQKLQTPAHGREEPAVINLMEALRKSLDQVQEKSKARGGAAKKHHRAAPRRKTG